MAVKKRFLPRTSWFLHAGDVGGETKHKRRQSILSQRGIYGVLNP